MSCLKVFWAISLPTLPVGPRYPLPVPGRHKVFGFFKDKCKADEGLPWGHGGECTRRKLIGANHRFCPLVLNPYLNPNRM